MDSERLLKETALRQILNIWHKSTVVHYLTDNYLQSSYCHFLLGNVRGHVHIDKTRRCV